MTGDIARVNHIKCVSVLVITVSPACIQHFVIERDPFCDRIKFYLRFGAEPPLCSHYHKGVLLIHDSLISTTGMNSLITGRLLVISGAHLTTCS